MRDRKSLKYFRVELLAELRSDFDALCNYAFPMRSCTDICCKYYIIFYKDIQINVC